MDMPQSQTQHLADDPVTSQPHRGRPNYLVQRVNRKPVETVQQSRTTIAPSNTIEHARSDSVNLVVKRLPLGVDKCSELRAEPLRGKPFGVHAAVPGLNRTD